MPHQVNAFISLIWKTLTVAAVVVLVGIVCWIALFWNITSGSKTEARSLIQSAFAQIPLGNPLHEAKSRLEPIAAGRGYRLQTFDDGDQNVIRLMTPPEIGTENWILTINGRNGRVVGKSIRMLQADYRPCGAPVDEGIPLRLPEKYKGRECYG